MLLKQGNKYFVVTIKHNIRVFSYFNNKILSNLNRKDVYVQHILTSFQLPPIA
jgi:hypothetical protein